MELPDHKFYAGCRLTQHDADRFTLERDGVVLHCNLASGQVTAGATHKLIATSVHGAVDECVLLLNYRGGKLAEGQEELEEASKTVPQTLEGMALAVGAQIEKLPPGILKTFKRALVKFDSKKGDWKE